MPAWLVILLVLPFAVLGILCHFYFVSRVLDGFYEREIKTTKERLAIIEGQLRELTI